MSLYIDEFPGFYVDTEPSSITMDTPYPAPPTSHVGNFQIDDDEEIIMYVAPHPRPGRETPAPTHLPDVLTSDLPSSFNLNPDGNYNNAV